MSSLKYWLDKYFKGGKKDDIEALKKSTYFCAYPFVQISTVPNGRVRPCCFYKGFAKKDDGDFFQVSRGDSFSQIWNSSSFKDIRKKMLNNERVDACLQCYEEEKTGKTSMRFRSFKEWLDKPHVVKNIVSSRSHDYQSKDGPRYLELKPGNLCNLKCRMCRSEDSNQIKTELDELSVKYKNPTLSNIDRFWSLSSDFDNRLKEYIPSSTKEWEESSSTWGEVEKMLPQLETISLAGGEPSLLPGTHRILQTAVDQRDSKHIHVFFASNLTNVPKRLLNVCTEFKMFEFIASIDGYQKVQEYIRYPSQWLDIDDNFRKIKLLMKEGQTKVLVNCTLQLYNILNYTEILDWLESVDDLGTPFFHHPFNLNILSYPNYLSIHLLPIKARERVIERTLAYKKRSIFVKRFPELGDRLDLICQFMKAPLPPSYEQDLKHFWNFTQIYDEHRKQSLKESIPELYEAVSQELHSMGLEKKNWLEYPLQL